MLSGRIYAIIRLHRFQLGNIYIDGRSGDPDMIKLDNCDNHQASYMNWPAINLRNKCKSLNVPSTGNKQDLVIDHIKHAF